MVGNRTGNWVVTARCQRCGGYFDPREMAEVSPGGGYNAYSGTCDACAQAGAVCQSEVANLVT